MKLIDIANKIDKSERNESYVNTDQFSSEFNYEFDWVKQDRLKAYWIGNWYCTDSYVGYRMYFLDDEPVAFSIQKGRKWSEKFNWISKELALKVREYLISIMPKREDELNKEAGTKDSSEILCSKIALDALQRNGFKALRNDKFYHDAGYFILAQRD